MKIILLITTCEKYKNRAINQINLLQDNESKLKELNIFPMFSVGKQGISLEIPFPVIQVDVEDQYVNLHKKIIESFKYIHYNVDYDFLIKIDDDTLFNVHQFNYNLLDADYIGSQVPIFVENIIELPMLGIFQKIKLYPEVYTNTSFSFMPGNFYILSKQAINYVIENLWELDNFKETEFIAEDQLVGFLLRNSPIVSKDIKLQDKITKRNFLQVTCNWMSIHPIMDKQFNLLSTVSVNEQKKIIQESTGKTSFVYRKMLTSQLQEKLVTVLKEFLNSKKSSGMC